MDDSVYERGYPESAINRLQEQVDTISPGLPLSIGRWDNRSTWGYHAEQSDEIDAIFADFDPWASEGGIAGPESMVYEGSPLDADDESPAEVGASEPALDDAGDVGVDGGDASGDYLAEETAFAPPDDPDPSDAVDEPDPAQLGGVLIRELGDALTTAKAIALMAVDDERFNRVGDYDKGANQTRLDELRAIQQAIREGVHPAFTDEQTEELQALETFLPFMQRIDDHAQGLRNAIREAGDLEVLTSIDIISNWPE